MLVKKKIRTHSLREPSSVLEVAKALMRSNQIKTKVNQSKISKNHHWALNLAICPKIPIKIQVSKKKTSKRTLVKRNFPFKIYFNQNLSRILRHRSFRLKSRLLTNSANLNLSIFCQTTPKTFSLKSKSLMIKSPSLCRLKKKKAKFHEHLLRYKDCKCFKILRELRKTSSHARKNSAKSRLIKRTMRGRSFKALTKIQAWRLTPSLG